MEYSTRMVKDGQGRERKVITVGHCDKVWNKETKAYTALLEQGFSILGWTDYDDHGKIKTAVKLRVSNIYFLAMQGKDGYVHYTQSSKSYNGMSLATMAFKQAQRSAGFGNAKTYLLAAFGKTITWEFFKEIILKEYHHQISTSAKAEAAKARAEAEQKARVADVLSSIAI